MKQYFVSWNFIGVGINGFGDSTVSCEKFDIETVKKSIIDECKKTNAGIRSIAILYFTQIK